MKNNFDLHKWKEYQLFLNEQEEFSLGTDDLELAKKFNIKYLTIGDIITPGMWNTEFGDYLDQNDVDEEFRGDVWKITNIEDENWDGEDFPHATLESNNGGEIYENVSILNSMLNTPYQIELPLDESFSLSDDDLELAKGFNVKELTIGDTIESYMVNDSGISGLTSKMPRKIVDIVGDPKDLVVLVDPQNPSEVQHWLLDTLNNDYLKPEYQIVDFISLNEAFELSDDDLELAKNFNIKYLTKDSTITPNMWDQNKIKNKAYTDLDFDENWKITDFDEDWSGDGEEETISVFLEDEDGWEISEYIENINLWLKPQFQVEESLNESFELNDDDLELAKRLDEYNGDIIVTFKTKVGYVYVNKKDEEEFERLNPGIRGSISYDDEPIYIFQTFKTDPFSIEIVQTNFELDSFTGPFTLQHFEEWIDNDIDYLEEIIYDDDINVEKISTSYTDVNSSPVKITKNMSQYFDYYDEFRNDSIVNIEFLNKINEDFELSDDDIELAKGFNSFPITVKLYNEYRFWNYETEEDDYITEIKEIKTDSEQLERILGEPISDNENDLENLLRSQYFENDDLMEFLNDGTIMDPIPEEYYGEDWDNDWEDVDIKVIFNNNLSEQDNFELSDDDLELAKNFNPDIIYLGKGDTIETGVISSENSYYIVGFEGNNILLKKGDNEYASKFPIGMVQRKMEGGYILDPYKK